MRASRGDLSLGLAALRLDGTRKEEGGRRGDQYGRRTVIVMVIVYEPAISAAMNDRIWQDMRVILGW
jgi:hypothetical protein